MIDLKVVDLLRRLACCAALSVPLVIACGLGAQADMATPGAGGAGSPTASPIPAPATPEVKGPPSATPPTPPPAMPGIKVAPTQPTTQTPVAPVPPPDLGSPDGKPHNTEIEPNGSPGIPDNATTESVNVPARTIVMVSGKSSYDDAFKSIKASLETLKTAMSKAGLKPSGHPITIFSEPDDKGFKYLAAIPIAAAPTAKPDLGTDVSIGQSPAGKAIKFQHRGAYEDIDSTYDVITAYLDAKGLQVDNPYIEEYLSDLTTPDDPNLQVDIYVFVKK